MTRLLLIFLFALLSFSQVIAQQFLDRSFENPSQGNGRPGLPWEFYEAQSTPDLQPGQFGYTLPAYHGAQYAGLVFREDSTTEYLGQRITPVLEADSYYEFSIWLANINREYPTMRVVGRHPDGVPFALWTSPLISTSTWKRYVVRFKTPSRPVQYLYFQCYYGRPTDRIGSVILDHIGSIRKVPPPLVELPPDTVLCAGDSLVLETANDTATYLWQDGSQGHSYTVKGPGVYIVTATSGNKIEKDTIEVEYGYLPFLNMGEDRSLCYGMELEFDFEGGSEGGSPTVSYDWNTGDSLSSLTINEPGYYAVEVRNGPCFASDSVEIRYRDCHLILNLPNVFSPNSDGINDAFVPIEIKDVYDMRLTIVDRWGRQVHNSDSFDRGWQGETQSGPAAEGVYYWKLHYQDAYGQPYRENGQLMLLR